MFPIVLRTRFKYLANIQKLFDKNFLIQSEKGKRLLQLLLKRATLNFATSGTLLSLAVAINVLYVYSDYMAMFHLFQTKHEGNIFNLLTVLPFVCVFRLVTLLYFGFTVLNLGHTINHYSSLPSLHFLLSYVSKQTCYDCIN